jgi:hypothetical protein
MLITGLPYQIPTRNITVTIASASYTKHFAKLFEPMGHRCLRVDGFRQHSGYLPHFCLHSRADNNTGSTAIGYHAARECHVGAVAEWYIISLKWSGLFTYRNRFTREGRFLDLEVYGFCQAQVSRDYCTCFKYHNIARDQVFSRHCFNFAIAQCFGFRGGKADKGFK